ncbi:MAG TPA: methyltransferase domain-containing protein [Magnetospirillaceae bacterium]|nr:methyltransferase domain-containing protein [Magnetospirillaceae bacterium]
MQLAILGRQNKLGLAELESLLGAEAVTPVGDCAALLTHTADGARLGGTMRIATPLHELPTTSWQTVAQHLERQLPHYLADIPDGKIKLGISVFGIDINERQLFATGLSLKKIARAGGRSLRLIPNTGPELNSAQVLNNKLIGDLGIELLVVKNNASTWIARTTWVQDVDDYAQRDFGRPKRDAFVGMLPPKLAQIMLNLAQARAEQVILDPFCGTGVVLQEAALFGVHSVGTDISEKMVDYSQQNMEWLTKTYNLPPHISTILLGDATDHTWQQPIDHIVCETYLGQPLSGLPKPEKLAEIIQTCDTIITKFLRNAAKQLKPGTRSVIAVPTWRVGNQFKHLGLLDHLENLGYNRLRFKHASDQDLIYHRADQIVGRELLAVIRK